MASRASELWHGIREEIIRMAARNAPERVLVDSIVDGRVKIKELGAPSALGEEYARLAGFKLPAGATVLTLPLGDKRIILGEIENTAPAKQTFDIPIEFEEPVAGKKGFNSPMPMNPIVSNSAVTASTTSTSVFSTNVGGSWFLPPGTWDVYAWCGGVFAHSAANGVVRVRLEVDATAGTELAAACSASPGRSHLSAACKATVTGGTINLSFEYRPNSTGTAYAGGGWIMAVAYRIS